eukprot:6456512-Alexandrium_andersonii.AAC.2
MRGSRLREASTKSMRESFFALRARAVRWQPIPPGRTPQRPRVEVACQEGRGSRPARELSKGAFEESGGGRLLGDAIVRVGVPVQRGNIARAD